MNQPIPSAQHIDFAFYVIFGISIVLLVGMTLVALLLVYRYRHERQPVPAKKKDTIWLEVVWILLPLFLVVAMYYYGWVDFRAMHTASHNAMKVHVVGSTSEWHFVYENGKQSKVLYVPVDTFIRLSITSSDVVHALDIPAFGIKINAVPGIEAFAWFKPESLGSHDIVCSTSCGGEHANMVSTIEVLSKEEFASWLNSESTILNSTIALSGKYGCSSYWLSNSVIFAECLHKFDFDAESLKLGNQ
ncbi:cytochrome c oxidase subunit II [Halodesulfovibrio sp.]|jgi:cytochrome c oxidase subunit 2|uniref:cytochrome c oxidase subunit II n=1 Tax=Halodesulfovibrio sp. TaxID=1912772 RepID=UPI0025D9267D|nr:cytochrome c oxidase subunit II [Halodesulfovibrio sp.]MCT4628149.1 cytochrome c oxidase subunit II [Halodesulfovibrio sp.]